MMITFHSKIFDVSTVRNDDSFHGEDLAHWLEAHLSVHWFKKMFKNIPPKAHREVIDEIVGVLRSSGEV